MTAINLALPIINCTSCNRCVGHLIKDYYKFSKQLKEMLNNNFDFTKDNEMITSDGRNIYKLFLQPYYLYTDEEDKKLFNHRALIVYSLLTHKQQEKEDYPFRNKLGDSYIYRYCCVRMFLCDASTCFLIA